MRYSSYSFTKMTKFETLPNEILLHCFQFFDAFDLFNAFDGLNLRFNQLIRQIPLQLNFESIRKVIFDQFCTRLLFDVQIRNQIYSLKLDQINIFFSKFSLNQFPHLQSLEILDHKIEQLKSLLPSFPQLHRLFLPTYNLNLEQIPTSKLKILSIDSLLNLQESSLITHLSIRKSSFKQIINNFFRYLPFLTYLRVGFISQFVDTVMTTDCFQAVHLKQLIFDCLISDSFEKLTDTLRLTPNLTALTLSYWRIMKLNAYEIQHTIESFLPLLIVLRFHFVYYHYRQRNDAISMFQQFQTDFWHREHQWFTEYVINKTNIFIYTLPNPIDSYDLLQSWERFPTIHKNSFDNIRSLSINPKQKLQKYHFYFPKIEKLNILLEETDEQIISKTDIQQLKSIINFAHIKHLYIERCFTFENPFDLFEQMPNLRELSLTQNLLASFLECSPLCEYLQSRIRILKILQYDSNPYTIFDHVEILVKFQKIFNNVENYTGQLDSIEQLIYLIIHLKKLSIIDISITSRQDLTNEIDQLKTLLVQRNAIYNIKSNQCLKERFITKIRIWI